MQNKQFSGVHAALLTPRSHDGVVDTDALTALVRFLLSKGITSFGVNGATGEFCLTTATELRVVLQTVKAAGAPRMLCGVGSSTANGAMELCSVATDEGADGLLLPMPYFFRYAQEDLDIYCRTVAGYTRLPVLLYNLPQFSSGLEKTTVRRLIAEIPNIVGIKDSSGSLEILRDLKEQGMDACKIVGNDAVLARALSEGVCDGVVSGVACALPELILDIFQQAVDSKEFQRNTRLLDELIRQLDQFPVPWALKWAVETRGVAPATFAQPITNERTHQADEFSSWLKNWLPFVIRRAMPRAKDR